MSVTNQNNHNYYTGDGASTVFAYTFTIQASGDISVWVNGVKKTLGADYTLSNVGVAGGGNVTFGVAPANTLPIIFLRVLTFDQQSSWLDFDKYSASTVANAFDKLTMLLIQLQQGTPVPLVFNASQNIDASTGSYFTVTATANFTLNAPTNPTDGQVIVLRVLQDATGGRTITFNGVFRFGTTLPSITLTVAANKADYITFRYNQTAAKWDVVDFKAGF